MQISADAVVTFHYRLREPGGEILEDSHAGSPVLYLHGHGGMLSGLAEAMAGREAGASFTVTLPPEKAYGRRNEGAAQRVSRKHILTRGKLAPGMVVQLNTSRGTEEAVVLKAGLKHIDVDGNHPLAGKTLEFAIEIVDVRPATSEELAHGHAHGVGGHHH